MKVNDAASALLCGTPGNDVMEKMKEHYTTLGSLSNAMSLVRGIVMEQHTPPNDAELRRFEEEGISEFLKASLRDKVQMQRCHARIPTWSSGAEAALARMRLLPKSMDTFHLSSV